MLVLVGDDEALRFGCFESVRCLDIYQHHDTEDQHDDEGESGEDSHPGSLTEMWSGVKSGEMILLK